MLSHSPKSSVSTQSSQLRTVLVKTRAVLLNTQLFFRQDSHNAPTNQQISKAIQAIDSAGRQLDIDEAAARPQKRFSS